MVRFSAKEAILLSRSPVRTLLVVVVVLLVTVLDEAEPEKKSKFELYLYLKASILKNLN